MNKVYTAGYQALKFPERLKAEAAQLGAAVVDIRYKPFSRQPGWDGLMLFRSLEPVTYLHLPEFGNLNYKNGGEIKLNAPHTGMRRLRPLLEKQPVILLCACYNYETCHRRTVAEGLARHLEVEIEEIGTGLAQVEKSLGSFKALSLKQPWAWLMVNGHKDIENRQWSTNFRGEVLVHASKSWDDDAFPFLPGDKDRFILPSLVPPAVRELMPVKVSDYQRGGIVGTFTIVDCVSKSDSPWFFGKYGFVTKLAQPLEFYPMRGQLNFFDVPIEIVNQLGLF